MQNLHPCKRRRSPIDRWMDLCAIWFQSSGCRMALVSIVDGGSTKRSRSGADLARDASSVTYRGPVTQWTHRSITLDAASIILPSLVATIDPQTLS